MEYYLYIEVKDVELVKVVNIYEKDGNGKIVGHLWSDIFHSPTKEQLSLFEKINGKKIKKESKLYDEIALLSFKKMKSKEDLSDQSKIDKNVSEVNKKIWKRLNSIAK